MEERPLIFKWENYLSKKYFGKKFMPRQIEIKYWLKSYLPRQKVFVWNYNIPTTYTQLGINIIARNVLVILLKIGCDFSNIIQKIKRKYLKLVYTIESLRYDQMSRLLFDGNWI